MIVWWWGFWEYPWVFFFYFFFFSCSYFLFVFVHKFLVLDTVVGICCVFVYIKLYHVSIRCLIHLVSRRCYGTYAVMERLPPHYFRDMFVCERERVESFWVFEMCVCVIMCIHILLNALCRHFDTDGWSVGLRYIYFGVCWV